mmetsp:Transcript_32076/g.98879  ORF Transcript_32076/g.98879 Transcript_32076/m.98879 type:complete len:210 (-) Transcript_32076:338-967(-)
MLAVSRACALSRRVWIANASARRARPSAASSPPKIDAVKPWTFPKSFSIVAATRVSPRPSARISRSASFVFAMDRRASWRTASTCAPVRSRRLMADASQYHSSAKPAAARARWSPSPSRRAASNAPLPSTNRSCQFSLSSVDAPRARCCAHNAAARPCASAASFVCDSSGSSAASTGPDGAGAGAAPSPWGGSGFSTSSCASARCAARP